MKICFDCSGRGYLRSRPPAPEPPGDDEDETATERLPPLVLRMCGACKGTGLRRPLNAA